MANLLEKMKKCGTIKTTDVLANSIYYVDKETVKTELPILNVAFSGDLDGGLVSGVTIIAGEKACYKTALSLYCMSSYLKKYDDAVALFYDNEFGADNAYFRMFGIDTNRVIHIPTTDLESLRFDIVSRLEQIERGDHVFILVDSLGNLASKKEYENAVEQNTAKDMTRSADIKGLFRIITPHINMKNIPFIGVNHVYNTMSFIPSKTVSGGCMVGTTLVQTLEGLKELWTIKEGDEVLTREGYHHVTKVWNPRTLENGHPDCLKITFDDGFHVICSSNHMFWVRGDWREAKDLRIGDEAESYGDYHKFKKIVRIDDAGRHDVYDIMVDKVHHYVLQNGLLSHNSGILYSANQIFIISKAQEKDGTDLAGWNFTINIEKSRFVKEKSKMTFQVLYDKGITKYAGLIDLALEAGCVVKPNVGWYSKVNDITGEPEDKRYRIKDTFNDEFWESILANEKFKSYVSEKYKLVN